MKSKTPAPLKLVVANGSLESSSGPYAGLRFRTDILECGHELSSQLGTTGYSSPKRRRCTKCGEGQK